VATRKTQKSQNKKPARISSSERSRPAATQAVAQPVTNGGPSFSRIQERAYELFQARGARPGNDWSDWFEAEQQLSEDSDSHAT